MTFTREDTNHLGFQLVCQLMQSLSSYEQVLYLSFLDSPGHCQGPSHFNSIATMKVRERWSLLDGELLRRHCTARATINHFLDQLVDIFDFPVTRTSYNGVSLPEIYSTPRKHSAPKREDMYMSMDETTMSCPNRKVHRSFSDRIRGLLLRPNRSETMTRASVAICNNSTEGVNAVEPRDLRVSWLSARNKVTSNAPPAPELTGDLWIDRNDHEQELDCSYQCLAEHAFI